MPNRKIKHIVAKLVGASTEETLDVYDVDAVHTDKIYNGLDQTTAGYVLDARQGKALNDSLTPAVTRLSGINTPFWENEYNYAGSITTTQAGTTVMDVSLDNPGVYLVNIHYTASVDNTLYVGHQVPGKSESYNAYLGPVGGSILYAPATSGYVLQFRAGGSTQTTWSRRWYSVMQLTKSN